MTQAEIVKLVERLLNDAGSQYRLAFQVSKKTRKDNDWLQVFVSSDATRQNRAAERQVIADVEELVTKRAKREILLVPVQSVRDSA